MKIKNYLLPGRTAAETVAQLQMERLVEPTASFKTYMTNLDTRNEGTHLHLTKEMLNP